MQTQSKSKGNTKLDPRDAEKQRDDGEGIWVNRLHLYESDETILSTGKWLNTALVNAAQKLIKEAFPEAQGLQDTMSLQTTSQQLGQFVQVMHINNNHWITISTLNCLPGTMQVFDSLGGRVTMGTKVQIATIIQCPLPELTFEVKDTEKQANGSDCGLFAIAVAFELCAGNNPTTILWQQDQMREHLKRCFREQKLTPFPKKGKRISSQLKTLTVPVYCVCRLPERASNRMAQCSACTDWYHAKCLDIPKDVFSKKRIAWTCSNCQ